MMDYSFDGEADSGETRLFDHQPLRLNDDDYERVQQIPLKKVREHEYHLFFVCHVSCHVLP
jgi:hypothetical protein